MTIELLTDFDQAADYAAWALDTGLWNGRSISPEGLNEFKDGLVAKIAEQLFSQDPESLEFQKMAATFAYIGSWEGDREECEEELAALQSLQNGVAIPAGLCKSVKKFWKKHKVEILVGIAVIAVVTAVAVGVLCTATAAAAAGTLAADGAKEKKDPPMPIAPPIRKEENPQEVPPWMQTNLSLDKDGVLLNGEHFSFDSALNWQTITPAIQSHGEIPFWKAYDSFLIREPETFVPRLNQEAHIFGNHAAPSSTPEPSVSRISDNYASSVLSGSAMNRAAIESPFQEIPLIGSGHQSTVHFHCGINNNEGTIMEGGSRLWETLDQNFAVHPHLIHSNSLIQGLTMVHLEKLDHPQITHESLRPMRAINPDVELALLPREILQNSFVQRSIDYEVSMLTKIAENIIEKKNSKLKQVHVAFSNGGHVFKEALKRLSPEHQQTVIVITAGTTAIIDEHLACKVYNVIGSKDWPSILCNGGMGKIERTMDFAKIEMILQSETDGVVGGHYFLQPEYQKTVGEIVKMEIINKYEIY